jgi:hypothetical protein
VRDARGVSVAANVPRSLFMMLLPPGTRACALAVSIGTGPP